MRGKGAMGDEQWVVCNTPPLPLPLNGRGVADTVCMLSNGGDLPTADLGVYLLLPLQGAYI